MTHFDEVLRDLERAEDEQDQLERERELRRHSEREVTVTEKIEGSEFGAKK